MGKLMTERQILRDAIDVGGIHSGGAAQITSALRAFGLRQMAFAGAARA